jgi:hypothetical protein
MAQKLRITRPTVPTVCHAATTQGSQLELKHGLGRSAISSAVANPAALFEHLCSWDARVMLTQDFLVSICVYIMLFHGEYGYPTLSRLLNPWVLVVLTYGVPIFIQAPWRRWVPHRKTWRGSSGPWQGRREAKRSVAWSRWSRFGRFWWDFTWLNLEPHPTSRDFMGAD